MDRIRTHLNYANVVATLALVVAVAGIPAAVAVTKAKKNTVTTKSIVNGTIKAVDLADGQVTASKLANTQVYGIEGQTSTIYCPAGERVLSGGGIAGGLTATVPSGPGSPVNPGAWSVTGSSGSAAARVLCLKASPSKAK